MAAKQVNRQRRWLIACEDQDFGVDDLHDDSARLMGQVDETQKAKVMQRNIGGDILILWYLYGTSI